RRRIDLRPRGGTSRRVRSQGQLRRIISHSRRTHQIGGGMRATDWEFRQRFFVFGLIFGLAFFMYSIDHVNAGVAIAEALAGPSADSAKATAIAHVVFGVGALLVVIAVAIRSWGTAYLRSEVVHDAALHSEGLVADGPYRRVRNPIYFGN